MKKIFGILVAALIVIAMVSSVKATIVITFDDLSTPSVLGGQHYGLIPATYAGFQWSPYGEVDGWNVGYGPDYKTVYGNTYNPPSANNFAYNSGLQITSVSDGLFNFVGAYFSTWAQNNSFQSYSSRTVTVKGYNGITLVGSTTWNLSSNSYNWYAANFQGIDKVEFLSDGAGCWWTMDNFTYDPIPEPGTILLLGSGFIGLGFIGWYRRRKA